MILLALMINPVLACMTSELETLIEGASERNNLEPSLLSAVLWQESRYCHQTQGELTTSSAGALGIGQLMPGTAAGMGVDPNDLEENLEGAARYLSAQLTRFGSLPLALAAYNAGPGAVERYGDVPPYEETQAYVSSVMTKYTPEESPVLSSAVFTHRQRSLTSSVVSFERKRLRSAVVTND